MVKAWATGKNVPCFLSLAAVGQQDTVSKHTRQPSKATTGHPPAGRCGQAGSRCAPEHVRHIKSAATATPIHCPIVRQAGLEQPVGKVSILWTAKGKKVQPTGAPSTEQKHEKHFASMVFLVGEQCEVPRLAPACCVWPRGAPSWNSRLHRGSCPPSGFVRQTK